MSSSCRSPTSKPPPRRPRCPTSVAAVAAIAAAGLLLLSLVHPCHTHEAAAATKAAGVAVGGDSPSTRNSRSFAESSGANLHQDYDASRHAAKFEPNPAVYTQPSCASCMLRKELKIRNLEFIKNQVLLKLGFSQAPNITALPKMTPQRMQEVIKKFGFPIPGAGTSDFNSSGMQGDDPDAGSYTDTWHSHASIWKEGVSVHEEDNDDFHAKTEKVIAFAQPYPRLRHSWKDHGILQFRFSDKIMRHRIKKATLYVYLLPSAKVVVDEPKSRGKRHMKKAESPSRAKRSDSDSGEKDQDYISIIPKNQHHSETITISVFKVYKSPKNPDVPSFDLIASEVVYRSTFDENGRWIPLEVASMLSTWFKAPRENLGFIVKAVDAKGNHIDVQHVDNDSQAPYVELYTIDVTQRRKKRSYGLDCTENSEERRCCRYPLTVDFQDFGWDWIIAPKQYQANYCSGECGYVFLQKFPHTHIASLAGPLQHDNKPTVAACCAPRKMSAISMLYFDHELNIIYGTLPNMVVDRCGCS